MRKRTGDNLKIRGDYQYRALTEGNRIQRFWHHSKLAAVEHHLPPAAGDKVLDVGCGSGVVSDYLGKSGASVLAIDANPDAIDFATRNFGRPNVTFERRLIDDLSSLEAGSFDKIFCLELIEHIYLEQTCQLFKTFLALLKPGGKIFITTPNYNSLWPLIEWLMDTLRLAPRMAEDQHVEHFYATKLQQLGINSGFGLVKSSTMCGMAPWVALLSRGLAKQVNFVETVLDLHWGSVLVCVFSKPKSETDRS
jgi:2-polyprenyl-3-methyl-5-hydroxy-6-metoxy-1,4-benzoquinol methylase